VSRIPAFAHTRLRVLDSDRSLSFYAQLGYEYRGRFQFETAYNIYTGLPEGPDTLELTVNLDRSDPYDLGDGYNHVAITVPDLDALLAALAQEGIHPEKPAFHPGGRAEYRIAFVQDPDSYRIELIDGGGFATPQDEDRGSA
jgi:lactoylglutathione lyase